MKHSSSVPGIPSFPKPQVFSNLFEKSRNKSRNSSKWWLWWAREATCCCSRHAILVQFIERLVDCFFSRLLELTHVMIGFHSKLLKCLAVRQSFDNNFVGNVIDNALKKLTAHFFGCCSCWSLELCSLFCWIGAVGCSCRYNE